jgi:transcriptional regulator with XRE-family HTH domain
VSVAIRQIGGRIRAERARRGVSLRSLARSVNLSPSLISQIETGKCRPSVSTLYAITTALGVSVEDVFGEQPAPADGKAGQAARPAQDETAAIAMAGAVAEAGRFPWTDGFLRRRSLIRGSARSWSWTRA